MLSHLASYQPFPYNPRDGLEHWCAMVPHYPAMFVIYHPRLGFLVDDCAGGVWSELRTEAKVYATMGDGIRGIDVARGNGLEVAEATRCEVLRWVT